MVFDGLAVHELIFDEWPYKVYDAKVKGTPAIKYIPFDYYSWEGEGENKIQKKETIYKGEGSVNFICYYPYAHTPTQSKKIIIDGSEVSIDGKCAEYYLEDVTEIADLEECKKKYQWLESSGILPASKTLPFLGLINQGDIPAPFIYEISAV